MTQVPYDDIRRALEKARELTTELNELVFSASSLESIACRLFDIKMELADLAPALLADAQRWRMIAEPSEEAVEKVARAIDRFQRGDDFLWRTEVDTARAVLHTLEGLVK